MTQKRKSLLRLRDARGRIRDVEAARTAQAAAVCEQVERRLATASHDLVSAVQKACDQLARARGVSELEAVHEDVGAARDHVAEARRQALVAQKSRRTAGEVLGRRERELRTTERALDMVVDAERRDGDRHEQRMVDDLVGAKFARGDL